MKLKIFSKQGTVRYQFDVVTIDEARKLADLHTKPSDTAYLYFQMKQVETGPLKDEKGRILSRAEVRRLEGLETVSKKSFTALRYSPQHSRSSQQCQ